MSIDYYRDANAGTANWTVASKQAPLPEKLPGKPDLIIRSLSEIPDLIKI